MSSGGTLWLDTTPVAPYPIGRWTSLTPVRKIRKVNTYVELPIFSYTVDSGWLGASYIRTQFSYSARRAFSIPELPQAPVGVNYCACVSYLGSDGITEYRYKLWENVGEVLWVPLYQGEKIGANFNIEIWTVASSNTVSNASAIRLTTGILTEGSCICCEDDLLEDVPTENTLLWGLLEGWDPSSETLYFTIAWPGTVLQGVYITTPEGTVIFVPEGSYIIPPDGYVPPDPTTRITEAGDPRITESGDERITE